MRRRAIPIDFVRRPSLRRVAALVVALGLVAAGVMATITTGHLGVPGTKPPQGFHAGPAHQYDAGGWTFAAAFPAPPTATRLQESLDGKPYVATFFSSASATVDMNVGVYPYPLGKPGVGADTFLRRALTTIRHSPVHQGLQPGKSTQVQGLPAIWLAATFDGGNMASFGVIVLDGHVAYEVVLTGPSTTINGSFRQALGAFKILDPARGIVAF